MLRHGDELLTLTEPGPFAFATNAVSGTTYDVRIETLPGRGSLRIDGLDAQAGDSITPAQLAGGSLVFQPEANGYGSPYARIDNYRNQTLFYDDL